MDTKLVKTSKNVRFYEGMNDIEILTPNSRQLRISLVIPLSEYQKGALIIMPPTLDSQHTSLTMIHDVPVRVLCDDETLGMIIGSLPDRYRVHLKDTIPITSCSRIKGCKNKLRGVYIVQIKTPHLLL